MAQFRATQSVDFFAYETLTVNDVIRSLTAATYAPTGKTPARYALITLETNSMRWTLDGTTPQASNPVIGHNANAGDVIELEGTAAIKRFQFGAATAGSAGTIRVSYAR